MGNIYEDAHGIVRCGVCHAALICSDCGDMPNTCPACGKTISDTEWKNLTK